jgi:hypothetical protein
MSQDKGIHLTGNVLLLTLSHGKRETLVEKFFASFVVKKSNI